MTTVLTLFQLVLLIIFDAPLAYLLFLVGAAAFYRNTNKPLTKTSEPERYVILVPAHDEALTLPATIETVKALKVSSITDIPTPLVVVVADNCTDDTAEIARKAGVIVYERHNTELRGKGHALQFAIEKLMQEYSYDQFNALVIFDADTVPDKNFLDEATKALRSGAVVIQGRYDVLKQQASWRTHLLYVALVLYNHIRPLGRASLKLSDGLRGNGMVFQRKILEQLPWQAFSLVEDIEYTNRLAMAGLKVTYVPEAQVYGQAATTSKQATSQRMRWEGGRWQQARQDVPPLLKRTISKKDWVAFDRAFDLLIPPLALLAIGLLSLTGLSALLWLLTRSKKLYVMLWAWVSSLFGLAVFVFGGLAVARVPLKSYLALLFAPFYIVWKLQIYVRMFLGRTPQQWVRTVRSKIDLNDAQVQAALDKRD